MSYDPIGNLISDGTWTYTWDHGRRLAKVSNPYSEWTYTYDANGMRTKKQSGNTVYTYVYNGSQLTQMSAEGYTLYFTYDADGRPLSVYAGGIDYYYYVTNLQGDVIALLNRNGAEVVTYTYDAWGKILAIGGSLADVLGDLNPLRYRGYVYDSETELYYLQSRYYNPSWGRFINADAYASTGQDIIGNNAFAYCGNNPVQRIDQSGQFWNIAAGAIIGGIISGVSQIITNKITGKAWYSDVISSTVTGALSGGLAATGLGRSGQVIANAIISGVSEIYNQRQVYKNNPEAFSGEHALLSVGAAVVLGASAGFIGGAGTKAKGSNLRNALDNLEHSRIKVNNTNYSCLSTPAKIISRAEARVSAASRSVTIDTSWKFWAGTSLSQYGMKFVAVFSE